MYDEKIYDLHGEGRGGEMDFELISVKACLPKAGISSFDKLPEASSQKPVTFPNFAIMKKSFLPFILILLIAACAPRTIYHKINFAGMAQGTYYAVTYYDSLNRDFQPQIDSLLADFDQSVSSWVPNSIISRINEGEKDVECDPIFIETYRLALEVAEESGGAFDYTVGPLVNAWGFGFEDREKVDQAMIDSLLPLVDYRKVRLSGNKIEMDHEGVRFDFNAVAQGYSVDLVGEFLASEGIKDYLVDIGGEVLAIGEKPGEGKWVIGIEKPSETEYSDRMLEATLELKNKAMATSGNYRKYYEENGVRYSHTIDPFTGYPVRHSLLSVSVIADDCGLADAWATAFMVMGLEKAIEILEERDDLEAFFIYSGEEGFMMTWATEGMKALLTK
jgi:thiamine biosynthesis lipoprotein